MHGLAVSKDGKRIFVTALLPVSVAGSTYRKVIECATKIVSL